VVRRDILPNNVEPTLQTAARTPALTRGANSIHVAAK
jgi:hypothetical protein